MAILRSKPSKQQANLGFVLKLFNTKKLHSEMTFVAGTNKRLTNFNHLKA